jgi:CheY-like chemotaxis protein
MVPRAGDSLACRSERTAEPDRHLFCGIYRRTTRGRHIMANILVIDDDPDAAELVSRMLTRAGHEVEIASNGRNAIMRLTGVLPDLVLLDLRMPEMDGVHFLEVLRSYLRWQSVPVILVTAYPEDPGIAQAAELGATEVFRKVNLDLDELRAAVEQKLWPRIAPERWGDLPPLHP